VVTVIGHPSQKSGDVTTTTVRSQSQVTLSAKDTVNGSSPAVDFQFTQTDSHPKIATLSRARNSVSFQVPTVTSETTYTYRLTVTDANGLTSTSEVNLVVKPVLDPNRFLTYTPAPGTYTVVIMPATSVAPDSAAAPDAVLGSFKLTVRRLLTYRDRQGELHTDVPLDVAPNATPIEIDGAWLARSGATASCANAPANPRFTFDIPSLNEDDINVLVENSDRMQELEFADVNEAVLRLQISVEQVTGTSTVAPQLCIVDPDDATGSLVAAGSNTATVSIEQLQGKPSDALDTPTSAAAYYRALGEENIKTTFFAWLDANGFKRAATNFGADAHAVYTNNFDLGFGRDMYMKVGPCDTPALNVGTCDVAAVVLNYPTLEAAAKKLGALNAVAMEYKATPASAGRRIVKFYAYAPDARDASGDFKRIHSVNLDGRGEKYLPEACTVCHGGTPGGLDTSGNYANGGDLNTGFLLWDLDTLLFSDTDQSFSSKDSDAALKDGLTRPKQEAELRKLNAGAYLTFADANRFALARELVNGWYKAEALPAASLDRVLSGTHDGAFVPQGWMPNGLDGVAAGGTPGVGNDDNPADAPQIYSQVYASHCRTCHVMQVPNPAAGDIRQAALCDADRPMGELPQGLGRQRPFACYWQFAGDSQLVKRLSEGTMPLSRLTMDRFWVQAPGATNSPAATLSAHLESVLGSKGHIVTPGTASVGIDAKFSNLTGAAEDEPSLDIGHFVRLDAQAPVFVKSYSWTLKRCTAIDTPSSCTIAVPVANASAASAAARLDATGQYLAELRVNSDTNAIAAKTFVVTERSPTLAASSSAKNFSIGASAPLSDLLVGLGNGTATDHRISISTASNQLTVTPSACAAPSSCDATTSIVLSSSSLVPLNSTVTFAVRDLNDAAPVQSTYPVSIASTITAGDRTICTRSNSSGANLSSNLSNCAAGTGLSSSIDLVTLNSAAFAARTDMGIQFPSGTQMQLTNFDGHRGTLGTGTVGSPARTRLVSYTPPLRFATHTKTGGTGLTISGQPVYDTVQYRLVRYDAGGNVIEQSNTATLRIQIDAQTSFAADVMPIFSVTDGLGCAGGGCHDGSMNNRPNYNQSAANVYAIFRGSDGSYHTLINKAGRAYVIPSENAATLSTSGLLCWPTEACTAPGFHTGGQFLDSDVQAIRKWIEDGANGF
jgi:mono/diheme cytochrome c family protein